MEKKNTSERQSLSEVKMGRGSAIYIKNCVNKLWIFRFSGSSALKIDSVQETTAWAQEHFQKSLSVNTAHCNIHRRRLKLHQAGKKPYVNMIQKHCHLLSTKAHLKRTEAKCRIVLWSEELKFETVFGNLGFVSVSS